MEANNITSTSSTSQLRWACRRGMLELDFLLGHFLDNAYAQLSLEGKQQFARLLTFQDPDIYAWLIHHEKPVDTTLLPIIELIRAHARPGTILP